MGVNNVNLQKAVQAVKNGMDPAAAAKKFGVKLDALSQAINPKGGGAPEDIFIRTREPERKREEEPTLWDAVCFEFTLIKKILLPFLPEKPKEVTQTVTITTAPPSISQVARMMQNGTPVKRATLKALIEREIKNGKSIDAIKAEVGKFPDDVKAFIIDTLPKS